MVCEKPPKAFFVSSAYLLYKAYAKPKQVFDL